MPTTGTKLYRFINGAWRAVYAELFDDAEKATIRAAFDQALTDAGLADERIWGERIEDRGSQITFSGLGQAAPLKEKEAWDTDRKKRTALQATLRATLPDLRSEEHTSELQSLMRNSYAVLYLKKKKQH